MVSTSYHLIIVSLGIVLNLPQQYQPLYRQLAPPHSQIEWLPEVAT